MNAHQSLNGVASAQPDRSTIKMVLVVDDHAVIRELLTEYLIRQNVIPVPVPDGAQAKVVCETLVPDAILLDLVLPDTDGLALIRQFKVQCPATSVVVISGWLDSELEVACRTAGAYDILKKPIDLERLGQVLARLLRASEEHSNETRSFGGI